MTDLILNPVLAAALAKKPRRNPRGREGGVAKAQNNFIADGQKTKAGAPLGNHNAARLRGQDLLRHEIMRWKVGRLIDRVHETIAAVEKGER